MATETEGTEQIVISGVPRRLREKIDKLAKFERRSRAAQTVLLLEEIVAQKQKEAAIAK